ETEKADAIAAKEKQGIDDLAAQKLEYDKRIEMMTTEERAAYDAKLADMTPTKDVEKMIAAAVAQGQADTIETIERQKLTGEYKNMLAASVILSAPFMTDGVLDPEKIAAEMATVGKMKVAAISGLIGKAKLMAAAANPAAQSAFDAADVPGTAPGGHTTDADLLSDLNEMDNAVGRRI
ncbi:MAG: hypothetical protein U9Q68_08700, partial [Euryarchaeota archaeon]|nr:hypothetical protein [Euryarchaeota archaeon]